MRLVHRQKSRLLSSRGGGQSSEPSRVHLHMPGCQDMHGHTHTHSQEGKKKYTEKVTPSPSNITMPSPGVKAPSEGLVHSSGQQNKKNGKKNGSESCSQKRKSTVRGWPKEGRSEQDPSHACLARELASTPGSRQDSQPPVVAGLWGHEHTQGDAERCGDARRHCQLCRPTRRAAGCPEITCSCRQPAAGTARCTAGCRPRCDAS